MKKLLHERMRLAFIATLTVLIPACVQAGPPNVGLKPLTADLVFGIPPVEEPVAPPDTFPDPGPISGIGGPAPIPPPPAFDDDCPSARFNEAHRTADPQIQNLPEVGKYRWKQDGFFRTSGYRIALEQFAEREISDVKKLAGSQRDFTFKSTQSQQLAELGVKQTFEVFVSRPARSVNNAVVTEVTSANALNGIYLTATEIEGPDGRPREARWNPPILYMPLGGDPPSVPVGVTFTTTSTNPDTLVTIEHTGRVTSPTRNTGDSPRQRYDACGTVVEGWWVNGFQTITFGDQTIRRRYSYVIGTQYGGMIIAEELTHPCEYNAAQGKCTVDPVLYYKTNIGQVEPS